MKHAFSKIAVLTAALVLVTAMLVFCASAAELTYPASGWVQLYAEDGETAFEGVEGTDLVWTVDKEGEEIVLTITGTATTLTFNSKAAWNTMNSTTIPWWSYASVITKVVIDAPITAINQTCAFNKLSKVHTFVLPETDIKISGSMTFAGMTALTTMGPEGTEPYTLDLRSLSGSPSQAFEGACAGETENTMTVLMPYAGSPMNTTKPFGNDTKILFKVLEGSESETIANTIKSHADNWDEYTSVSNRTPHTKYVTVEYYDINGLQTVSASVDGMFKATLDLTTGALVVLNTGTGSWKQFDTHNDVWQNFKAAWGNYIRTATVDKFDKISFGNASNENATPLFAGLTNLETVKFMANQRMQNGKAAEKGGWFQGCTALKSITFGGDLVDGVFDYSGMTFHKEDSAALYLTNLFNGCAAVQEIILPDNEFLATVNATTFAGCTNLKSVTLGTCVTAIEDGAFDSCPNVELKVYEDSYAHTWAEANNIAYSFIVDEETDPTAPITGDFAEKNDLTYHFDPVTGILTISGTDEVLEMDYGIGWEGHTLLDINGDGIKEIAAQLPWLKFGFANSVKEVVIEAPITKVGAYMLSRFTNCEKMTIPATLVDLSANGAIAYNDSLDTVVIAGGEVVKGTLDFTNITKFGGYALDDSFDNVSPTLVFSEKLEEFSVAKIAQKCPALKIVACGGTGIDAWAARYLAGEFASDTNVCQNITFEYELFAPMVFTGYSVRVADYNGLRGLFSASDASVALVEALGYTVKEYGTVVGSAANIDTYGLELNENDLSTKNEKIIKTVVYQDGEIVGKLLNAEGDFAVTIIDIAEANYETEFTMYGYAVIEDAEGTVSVVYTDTYTDSIYSVAVGMYESGVLTDENGGIALDIINYKQDAVAAPVAYTTKSYL